MKMLDKTQIAFRLAVEAAMAREDKKHPLSSEQLDRIGLVAALQALRIGEGYAGDARIRDAGDIINAYIDAVLAEE